MVLIFPLDLEDIEEVGPGRIDLDDILVRLGDGVRKG